MHIHTRILRYGQTKVGGNSTATPLLCCSPDHLDNLFERKDTIWYDISIILNILYINMKYICKCMFQERSFCDTMAAGTEIWHLLILHDSVLISAPYHFCFKVLLNMCSPLLTIKKKSIVCKYMLPTNMYVHTYIVYIHIINHSCMYIYI